MFASRFSAIARSSVSQAFLSTAVKTRPFRILGIQQVAIGCEEKGPLDALWKGIFGLEASATKRLEKENVEEGKVPFPSSPIIFLNAIYSQTQKTLSSWALRMPIRFLKSNWI